MQANNKNEKYQKIMEKKMAVPIEVQCRGLPLEFSTYLNYCRSLKFDDKPDYFFLRRMFRELLERRGDRFDYQYDWTLIQEERKFDNGKIKIELKENGENMGQSELEKLGGAKIDERSVNKESDGGDEEIEISGSSQDEKKNGQSDLGMDSMDGEENIDEHEGVEGDNPKQRL